MKRVPLFCAALAVCLAPSLALAHGGSYRGPKAGGQPGGGQVPPGTADPPAPVTRWESWWASNKEYYLRLATRMRFDENAKGVTTPSKADQERAEKAADDQRKRRSEADSDVRESLVPIFVEALADSNFEVRTAAAIALGKAGDLRALEPLLTAAVEDDHKDVRDSAVLALGLLGNESSLLFLDGVLNDPKEGTRHRSFAAFSLGLIGGEDAAAALLRFLDPRAGPRFTGGKRPQNDLLASTYIALGLTDRPEVIPVLRAALDDKKLDDGVRAFVVLSLGRAGDRGMLERFSKMATKDKDQGLRRSAAIALGKLATPGDAEAVAALEQALHADNDPVTRHFAGVALGTMADEKIIVRLRKRLVKADGIDRPFLALALGLAKDLESAPALRKALEAEKHESTRGSYCIALGLMGDKDSVALLETQLDYRGQPWLQGYAALSLGMLGSKSSAPLLRERLANTNDSRLRMNLAVSLGLLHDGEARTFLEKTLAEDGTLYERGGAAMAMGVLRMNASMPGLLGVYRDKKEMDLIRAFSVVALGVLADPAEFPKLARFAIDNNYATSAKIDPLTEVLSIL